MNYIKIIALKIYLPIVQVPSLITIIIIIIVAIRIPFIHIDCCFNSPIRIILLFDVRLDFS